MKPYDNKGNSSSLLTVRLSTEEVEAIDYHAERLGYPDRSKLVRTCLEESGLLMTPGALEEEIRGYEFGKGPTEVILHVMRKFGEDKFDETVRILQRFIDLNLKQGKKMHEATRLRLALENIYRKQNRYIGKTHLAVAFKRMGYSVSFYTDDYFNANFVGWTRRRQIANYINPILDES